MVGGERHHDRQEWREGDDPPGDDAPVQMPRARNGRDGEAERRQSEVGAEQVDDDAEPEPLAAGEGGDHRQADEGGVAPAADQEQRAGALPRPPKRTADRDEQDDGEEGADPRGRRGDHPVGVELEPVDAVQGGGGKRDIDHPAAESLRRGVGQPPAQPKQHAYQQACQYQNDLLHRRPKPIWRFAAGPSSLSLLCDALATAGNRRRSTG